MLSRLAFVLITFLFVVMNVLLWRSEISGKNQVGSVLSADVVWKKVLMAPDNSKLEIWRAKEKVGFGVWSANVADAERSEPVPEDLQGMVEKPTSYTIDFDGNISMKEVGRVHLECRFTFNEHRQWQDFSISAGMRPNRYELRASVVSQSLTLNVEEDGASMQKTFKFADLQNPSKVLGDLGVPLPAGMLAALGLQSLVAPGGASNVASGLKWEARNDWMRIGSDRMRVYRLRAELLDRFDAVLFVSTQGEILRVELPGEILFVNDGLTSF